jgi:hypothetical protein
MGLISGGITALSTGSLKQGLGAGLTTGLIGGAMSGLNAPNPTDNVLTGTPALTEANLNAANTGLAVPGTFNPALSSAAPQTLSGMNTQLNVAGTFNPALQGSSNVISQAAPVAVPPAATTAIKTATINKGLIFSVQLKLNEGMLTDQTHPTHSCQRYEAYESARLRVLENQLDQAIELVQYNGNLCLHP